MIKIHLSYNRAYRWHNKNGIYSKGFVFDKENQLYRGAELIDYLARIDTYTAFLEELKSFNGHFSIIIQRGEVLWAASDWTRSFPLYYHPGNEGLMITDNPDTLAKEGVDLSINEANAIEFQYCGFVTGDNTLLNKVYQLVPGQAICFENNRLEKTFYIQYLTQSISKKTKEELKDELKGIIGSVGKRLVELLDNRPVAIPLSAGFDSRLMAYLLKKNNYSDVTCFTYGMSSIPELRNAKKTAEILAYPHLFIDYKPYAMHSIAEDRDFIDYLNFSTNYASKVITQDYFGIRYLRDKQVLKPDTVIVPGQNGIIAGGGMKTPLRSRNRKVSEIIIENDFTFLYPDKQELDMIKEKLSYLDKQLQQDRLTPPHLYYENWLMQERAAKLLNNNSKVWEYFHHEFLFPLMDKELYSFFVQLPPELKTGKKLYKEVLAELFEEQGIYYGNQEIYPSPFTIRKTMFTKMLKRRIAFLKRFSANKGSKQIGSKYYTKAFAEKIIASGNKRKILSTNGIISVWQLIYLKEKLGKSSND